MSGPRNNKDRLRLSVAMIVRDASRAMEETLRSIRSITDEIVVLDTGSADDTTEVAQKLATVLVQGPWQDDFSAARNQCLAEVCGDWVLWLDAGETLSEETAGHLRRFIDTEADPAKAYMLLVKAPSTLANVVGEQLGQVRLVPNHPAIRFDGRVRETLTESLQAAGIAVEGLPWHVEQAASTADPQNKIRKASRDLRLAELAIQEHGPQPRWLNCLGEALQTLGDQQRAAECFCQSLQTSEHQSTQMLEAYYGRLTLLDEDPDDRGDRMAICLESLEIFPLDAQLLCAMGGYLQAQGRLDLATRAYRTAYRHGQVNPETWHVGEIRELAAVCLSLSLQLQQQNEEAGRVLEDALADNSDSVRLRRQLIDLYAKQGRPEDALAQVNLLPAATPKIEALRSAVRGACLGSQQNWISALAYLKTAHSAGCRDPLCLRWLCVALLSTGDIEGAQPILHQWQEAEPQRVEIQKYLDVLSQTTTGDPASERPTTSDRQETVQETDTILPISAAVEPASAEDTDVRRTRIDRGTPSIPHESLGPKFGRTAKKQDAIDPQDPA